MNRKRRRRREARKDRSRRVRQFLEKMKWFYSTLSPDPHPERHYWSVITVSV